MDEESQAPPATPKKTTWPQIVTVIAAVALLAAAFAGIYTLRQDIQKLESVLESGLTVEVGNIVQTAAPKDAILYGSCRRVDADRYRISVTAFAGGIEHTVSEGRYAGSAASSLGQLISEYYGYMYLDFGDKSESCNNHPGWRPNDTGSE